jgi:hypothetical protein
MVSDFGPQQVVGMCAAAIELGTYWFERIALGQVVEHHSKVGSPGNMGRNREYGYINARVTACVERILRVPGRTAN